MVMLLNNASISHVLQPDSPLLQPPPGMPVDGSSGRMLLPPWSLSGSTILTGPFNHVPSRAKTVSVDLGNSLQPLFIDAPLLIPVNASSSALERLGNASISRTSGNSSTPLTHLMVVRLMLKSLGAAPFTVGPDLAVTALPLWALRLKPVQDPAAAQQKASNSSSSSSSG